MQHHSFFRNLLYCLNRKTKREVIVNQVSFKSGHQILSNNCEYVKQKLKTVFDHISKHRKEFENTTRIKEYL